MKKSDKENKNITFMLFPFWLFSTSFDRRSSSTKALVNRWPISLKRKAHMNQCCIACSWGSISPGIYSTRNIYLCDGRLVVLERSNSATIKHVASITIQLSCFGLSLDIRFWERRGVLCVIEACSIAVKMYKYLFKSYGGVKEWVTNAGLTCWKHIATNLHVGGSRSI